MTFFKSGKKRRRLHSCPQLQAFDSLAPLAPTAEPARARSCARTLAIACATRATPPAKSTPRSTDNRNLGAILIAAFVRLLLR